MSTINWTIKEYYLCWVTFLVSAEIKAYSKRVFVDVCYKSYYLSSIYLLVCLSIQYLSITCCTYTQRSICACQPVYAFIYL